MKRKQKYKPTSIKQDIVSELHRLSRKNFKRRRYVVKSINESIQADLIEMIKYSKINNGFKYILAVIDTFSKFAWVRAIKSKNAKDVSSAMNDILLKILPPPKNLQTDQGKEFYNKEFNALMKIYKIKHYSVYTTIKCAIVERFIKSYKNLLYKQFSLQGNYRWINILNSLIEQYNASYHRTIKMAPAQVNKKNERAILQRAYTNLKIANKINKFSIGDHVRISRYRSVFDKGYTPNWSNEIFIIRDVKLTNPTTYLLKDKKGENILGGFYELELQKVKHSDVYLVEKILKKKGNQYFIKWFGLDNSYNSWIDKKNLNI